MRILIITQAWPEPASPGHGLFIQRLCAELHTLGHAITVLAPRVHPSSPRHEVRPEFKLHRFAYPSGGRPLGARQGIPALPMACYLVSGLVAALRLIRRTRPDMIHGHWIVPSGLIAALSGRLTGTPVLLTAHGMDVRMAAHPLARPFFNLSIHLASQVTVVSTAMHGHPLLQSAPVIPCGVDQSFFASSVPARPPVIVSTRHLDPLYDVGTLIRGVPSVLARHPETHFFIIGAGRESAALQTLARTLGAHEQVTFTGRLEQADLAQRLTRGKVYVSTSPVDGTSVSLLEALAAGLVPVVTDIPANRPWIEHGHTGWLFPPGDEQALAAGLFRALDGDLSAPGLELRYRWDHIAREISDSYFQLQAPSRHRSRS